MSKLFKLLILRLIYKFKASPIKILTVFSLNLTHCRMHREDEKVTKSQGRFEEQCNYLIRHQDLHSYPGMKAMWYWLREQPLTKRGGNPEAQHAHTENKVLCEARTGSPQKRTVTLFWF